MLPQVEILLIAVVVAMACVLPGTFLVLRGVALMSDAISHAILLGIVLMFFVVKDLNSPWLILGAAMVGLLTVTITELLIQTRRLKKDAAIGLVFPVFFSIGVILISKFAGNVHLDTDAVLLGELAFAPFERLLIWGVDVGPKALWTMGTIFITSFLLLVLFYKELKLATFDSALATSLGMSPLLIHYGIMGVTSVTAVGAFDAVGSILVVALMIVPPATAYLLTHRLTQMLFWSLIFGVASAICGYGVAHIFDTSIAGMMTTMSGVFFLVVLFFSTDKGLVWKWRLAKTQQLEFSCQLLMVQLLSHEGTPKECEENTISNMVNHMGWTLKFANLIVQKGVQNRYLMRQGEALFLTPLGRERAKYTMVQN
ncbi:zinc ABC transporter permease [Candidatus Marinamargulisbacteria bacterium SCGC AG-439-L15]|nr:zinc ABC transporter permease [Candidatus Marinamargulisbacteria bacterium SCGC AG-439-L15]